MVLNFGKSAPLFLVFFLPVLEGFEPGIVQHGLEFFITEIGVFVQEDSRLVLEVLVLAEALLGHHPGVRGHVAF